MSKKQEGNARGLTILLAGLLAGGQVFAATLEEMDRLGKQVDQLGQTCEAARQKALAPIRAQKTQDCIEQQLRSKGHCERYYTTYGNVSVQPSGAPSQGYFFDLPPCQEWLSARQKLEAEHGRP